MRRKTWVATVYIALLIIGIPWYWPEDIQLIVLGIPIWVFVAIVVSVLTSIFTAFILLRYSWKTDAHLDE